MTTLRSNLRLDPPDVPRGQVRLLAPPVLQPRESPGQVLAMGLPALAAVGSVLLIFTGNLSSGRSATVGGLFLVSSIGAVAAHAHRQGAQRRQRVSSARSAYLRYLHTIRTMVRAAAHRQHAALTWLHPDPAALPSLAADRVRLWERSSGTDSYLQVRYGLCAQPLALELVPPDPGAVEQVDPVAASALHRLLVVHGVQPDLPASIDLRAFARIEVTGHGDQARSLARSMICSAAAFHGPDNLVVAVLSSPQHLVHWDWLKWLPHALSARESDAVGPRRMVTTSLVDLGAMLPDLGDRPRFGADVQSPAPHILLVVDSGQLPPGNGVLPPDGLDGVTLLDLPERGEELDRPTRLQLRLEELPAGTGKVPVTALRFRSEPMKALADQCDLSTAEAFARRLAPLHTVPTGGAGEATGPADFMALLGVGDVSVLQTSRAWGSRPARDRLRVPIGVSDGGSPVHLDLKESAQQGMGPHGLVIGATGSGKSEFLRTLVLGLAMTHSPEQLNMVLVDFKGGATFAGMSGMPHVSAVITNLVEELTLVDRMQDALSGEMIRRQELLRSAGNYASIRDYDRARAAGENLAPLPSLFIVVDEFSEMLSAKPEFIDLFVAIGRLGRSLGLHLLLASQRLEEGRLRGLESHLSYRVGLRTFSASESRAVLGVPDACELPAVPGLGFLKPDPSTLLRFKAAHVSGPNPGRPRVRRDSGDGLRGILPFTIAQVLSPEAPDDEVEQNLQAAPAGPTHGEQPSLLDVAVRAMQGHGPAAHAVWLPPLEQSDTLDQLMPDLVEHAELGLHSPSWRGVATGLTIPIGTIDRPREQRRETMTISLTGAAGHAAVVGGPRSGKSTLLRSMVTSLALTTTPLESQFYVLDFGGGTFAPMAGLPHVAGVGTRSEPDVVRRIVAELEGIVGRREAFFRASGIDSIETYRSRRSDSRAEGRVDDGHGDVFLVVDGWSTVRADFDDLEIQLQALAQRGLTFGLHLLVTAGRWADFRSAMRDIFGTRLELRLGDPLDSEIDRKVAQLVPTGRPGRGLVASKHHFLAALPRIDGRPEPATLGEGVEQLVLRSAAAWRGPDGPKLRLLPDRIALDQVQAQAEDADRRLLLGVSERDLAPVGLDLGVEPHLLVFGDSQSGKSALLRSVIREIVRTRSPKEAQIIAVDYRRSLLGEIPEDYQLDHLTSSAQATPSMKDLADYLTRRLPGPDLTPDQLRNRSWWSGADAYVLVDDYDLVATQQGSPLAPLAPLLAQARDTGFHVILTRRSGGASRALYEPVIQGLRDLAMPGLLLSGSPDEGALLGNVRPSPQPPGRGRLVTRGRSVEVVQLAWTDPTH